MFTITESNRAHKGECLTTKRTNTAKQKSHVFLIIHILLTVSQKRGSNILFHCVQQMRGSPSFPLAEFFCCRSKNRGIVRLRQCSTNLEPIRKKAISLPGDSRSWESPEKEDNYGGLELPQRKIDEF